MTNSGGTRELSFHRLLQSGWLKPYHDKIVYVFRGVPPPKGFDDGVYADAYMRFHLTRKVYKYLNIILFRYLFCTSRNCHQTSISTLSIPRFIRGFITSRDTDLDEFLSFY